MRYIICVVALILSVQPLSAQRRVMVVNLKVDDTLNKRVPKAVGAVTSGLQQQLSFAAPFFDWQISNATPNIEMTLSLGSPYEQVELAETPRTLDSCSATILSAQTYRELIKKAKDNVDDELAENLPPVSRCVIEKLGRSIAIAEKTGGLPTEDYIIAALHFQPSLRYFYYLRMFSLGISNGENIPLRRYPDRDPDDKLLLQPGAGATGMLTKRDKTRDKLYVDVEQLPEDRVGRFWKRGAQ